MFGNFGWMGKIASLFLGSLAMKNMRAQQYYMPYQLQLPMRQGSQMQTVERPVEQQYQPELALNNSDDENESHTIKRGRS